MRVYTEAFQYVFDQLGDSGAAVVWDIRDVNPPCVYLVPGRAEYAALAACDVDVVMYLVAPNAGTAPAIDVLDQLLETVRMWLPVRDVDGAAVATPAGGDPLRALRTSINVRVKPDQQKGP